MLPIFEPCFKKNRKAIWRMDKILLVDKAIEAALRAGYRIREVYASTDFFVEQKEDETPVTLADHLAHQEIYQILKSTSIPVLSEEGNLADHDERRNWEKLWLVDPLDGTKEFIKRNDEFTVNIALIMDGHPILGIVYAPVFDTLYVGMVGHGAWRIQSPTESCTLQFLHENGVSLPDQQTSGKQIVLLSRSHMNTETEDFISQFRKKHANVELQSKGSSLKLCMIAEGSASIYPKLGTTMEWDTAAGHALLLASGKNIFLPDLQTELIYNKENLQNPHFIAL